MFNNSWFKKEKPIQGLTGMWGGAAGALTVGAGGTFVATGGNMSYLPGPAGPTHYTVHTFVNGNTTGNPQGDPGTNASSQSFVVTSGPGGISSFDYLVLGGGGGGGGSHFGPITQMDGGSGGGGGNPPAPPAPAGGETAASPDGISPTAQGNDGGSGTSYSSNTGGGGGGGGGGAGSVTALGGRGGTGYVVVKYVGSQ